MVMLKERETIAAKAETTPGTAETLTASEGAYNAYDIEVEDNVTITARESPGRFNRRASAVGPYSGRMRFKTDIQWDGTTITLPAWADVLLPACGWVKSTATFTPRSEAPGSNVKTLTLGHYLDGRRQILAGCAGTFRVVLRSGEVGFFEWDFMGVWAAPTDVAMISPTYPTDTLIKYASGTTTWQSVDQCVSEVVIDAGNELYMRPCADTASGFKACIITDRNPTISMDPETALVAADDKYGDWLAGTQGAISIVLDGPSSSTLTFTAPKAEIQTISKADRGKVAIDNVTFSCNRNGTTDDEELSIVFA